MAIIDKIKDGLKSDFDTEISVPLVPKPSNVMDSGTGTPVSHKNLEESRSKSNSYLIRRRLKKEKDNKETMATGQRAAAITQSNPTPESQAPKSSLPQQRDLALEVKAETSMLNIKNNYLSAVEKDQENTLKYNDAGQIQHIQNELSFRKPIPIDENVGIKSEFPRNVLPPEWMALLYGFSAYLNVPVIALVSGLLVSVCVATLGRFRIEVEKDRYYEAFTMYFIVVMLSGAKKSAIVQLFKWVFDKRLKELQAEHDAKVPDPIMIKELYVKSRKKLIGELSDEVLPNEISEINCQLENIKQILAPLKAKMENSFARPSFFNDSSTMKKLGENMAQQNEFTAIFDAEPGIWKNYVRANENVILLKGYTMEFFGRETATNGSVILESPCITICSYVQPGVAFKLYSKEDLKDDGLLPRVLPVFCLSKPDLQDVIAQEIDPELMAMYEAKITNILEYCFKERKYEQGN